MKRFVVAILLSSSMLLVACQTNAKETGPQTEPTKEVEPTKKDMDTRDDEDDSEVEEIQDDSEKVKDRVDEGETVTQLELDLNWMEENNEDAIPDSNYGLLKTRDEELLGPTISYSLLEMDNEFETKPELYVSFNGDHYKIELGWFPPNMHGINITSLNTKERENTTFEFPEMNRFDDFVESDEVTHLFNENTVWQITAADITGNGVLELILLAYDWNYEMGTVNKAVSVYEYAADKEVPFELSVHFKGMNMTSRTDQTMYFTESLEFVHDSYREDIVEAYYEDGEWYIPEES